MPEDAALSALAKPIEGGESWPRPRCPKCQTGHIGFSEPVEDEDPAMVTLREHEGYDPDWIRGTFTVRGQCENPTCRQVMYGTGDYSVSDSTTFDWDGSQWTGPAYSAFYTVTHLHPPVLIMSIPSSAPPAVRKGVSRASRVLFADPGLAATALRATVELFLTSEGIASRRTNGKFRSAHERIVEWVNADTDRPAVKDLFFAVKWLGNSGTHEDSDLTAIEVLDGARVLEEAFHRLFTGTEIEAHARSIIAAEGPPR